MTNIINPVVYTCIKFLEYNVMQPPPLNEKVLKDKRKKLKETLDRVLKMYVSITYIMVINFLQKLLVRSSQQF